MGIQSMRDQNMAERRRVSRVIFWIIVLGAIFTLGGVALVALTNKAVMWSSSNAFCGTVCHSMTWASLGYQQGPHFINASGVRASCGECHIPYESSHATATEYVKLLLFKADRGAKDFWNESRKSIATKEEWEKRRPLLEADFENYLRAHNYITCRGCHALEAFGGSRSHMKVVIHQMVLSGDDVDCLRCHRNIGHVYQQPGAKVDGWYTMEQAGNGEKALPGALRGLPRSAIGGRRGTFAEGRFVAPDVWGREIVDGVGRDQRADGAVCWRDFQYAAVIGYSGLLAEGKWVAFRE